MRRDAVEALEMPDPRRQPVLRLRHVHQPGLLVLPLDVAHRVDAERVATAAGKRSCEDGIRISAIQPASSILTADSHTASHDPSVHESL